MLLMVDIVDRLVLISQALVYLLLDEVGVLSGLAFASLPRA